MAIDWLRIQPKFLASDGSKSYWRYPSSAVHIDIHELDICLPTYPKHELIACKDSILAIFYGKTVPEWRDFPKIGATINRITDTMASEGMNPTVANEGEDDGKR